LKRSFVLLAGVILAFIPACKNQSQSSPPTRTVVLYCSVDQEIAEPIVALYEKRTGVKVQARYDVEASKTVGLVQKIRAESESPLADVFWSNEPFYTVRLAREGLLRARNPHDKQTQNWPTQFRDARDRWHGFALRARVIAYSPKRMPRDQAPRTLEDLLDAKWKGRLVMARPEFGTTGGDVASWFAHYGPDKAKEILRGLKANEIRLVDGNSTAMRAVVNGLADIALTDSDDVYAQQRNGQDVAFNYLDQGGDGVLTIPNTVAIIEGAPHSTQAAALMDFIMSAEVEKLMVAGDGHYTPIRPDLAARFPQYAINKPLKIDYEKVADHLNEAIQAAQDIFKD
jgi:iron(III) transport system substrate-binding protein